MRAPRVVIVGAGPAGVAMAVALGAQNIRALVLERHLISREKPGECLPPSAGPLLRRLGVELDERVHSRCPAFVSSWSRVDLDEHDFLFNSQGEGWVLDRPSFERQLSTEAERCGAVICRNARLQNIARSSCGWQVRTRIGTRVRTIDADFVVDASGRSGVVSRWLGVSREHRERLIASWALVRGNHSSSRAVRVEAVENGWWYAVTVPDGRRSVAFFGNSPLRDPHEFSRVAPSGIGLLGRPDRIQISSAESSCSEMFCGPGWFAIGDAAMTFDPLASHGITFALGTAWYAARALISANRGMRDAYAAYDALLTQRWVTYLHARANIYGRCRYAEQPFWARSRVNPFGDQCLR